MLSLRESLFDKDIINKNLVDWDRFKEVFVEKNPDDRHTLFRVLERLLHTNNIGDEELTIWYATNQIEEFHKQHIAFDYIIGALQEAFKKQSGDSWIFIDDHDFEKIHQHTEELPDNERHTVINKQNWLCERYKYKAHRTPDDSYFLTGNSKLSGLITYTLEEVGKWDKPTTVNKLINNPKEWAADYYDDPFIGQQLWLYVCPKNLDPTVKKLLYY